MTDSHIRRTLVAKGLVRAAVKAKVDQQPGKAIAVRRVDDRPTTRVVPTIYKKGVSYAH